MKRLFIHVYLYMLIMFLIINFVVAPIFYSAIQNYYFRAGSLDPYWRDIFRGFYHTIETDLKRLPVDQWEPAVKDLQPHFAYPIQITPMASLPLPASEVLALNRGEIVIQSGGVVLRHQIDQSGMLLCMGPVPEIGDIPDLQSIQYYIQILFCSVFVVLGLFFALIWALPQAKNLKRISTAAAAFGQGALEARATISKRSSLAPLAQAFNSMADRIQELITSHRELTHTVSHELRTPLARIRFDMEMMASARECVQRERHHEAIRRNVDELEMLISELLTYARFDHKNFHLQTEILDLAPWLIELTAAANHENGRIRIDCRIDGTDPNVPSQVNPRFLARAVGNLLQNAARYSRQRIHVTLATEDQFRIIHVDDDGPGVAGADRQRIFEPFVRLDDSKSDDADGYGLGLAIVRRVAEWHGGRAEVADAPIGGARFTLRWPNP
jgi:two-component system sensor histidine kinase RstB/two-component system sensor kinase ParS